MDGFEKTETFAQEQKVYFLILCNKTTASGRSIVSSLCFIYVYLLTLVSMLCLCRHTLSQRCVRLSNGRSLSKATSGLSTSAVTHLEQFTGSRTQCGGLELDGFSVTLYSDSEVNKVQFGSKSLRKTNTESAQLEAKMGIIFFHINIISIL